MLAVLSLFYSSQVVGCVVTGLGEGVPGFSAHITLPKTASNPALLVHTYYFVPHALLINSFLELLRFQRHQKPKDHLDCL